MSPVTTPGSADSGTLGVGRHFSGPPAMSFNDPSLSVPGPADPSPNLPGPTDPSSNDLQEVQHGGRHRGDYEQFDVESNVRETIEPYVMEADATLQQNKILRLLRHSSTKLGDSTTSLEDYISRMDNKQPEEYEP